jgi:hypothetical protein
MEIADNYAVVRTFDSGRPSWGRWEVRDATGLLVGIVAEQPAPGGHGRPSTFTAVHNPGPTPFVLRFPQLLRARGAWWSSGHDTVSAAVASLVLHLHRPGGRPSPHFLTRADRGA